MISFFPILVDLQHKPLSGADTVESLPKLNLKLKYIIINIIGDYKGSLINLNWRKQGTKNNDLAQVDQTTDHFFNGYRVERNFCGSLFLRIGDFCVLRELIFTIRTDWFFLLGIDFGDFRKYPVPSIDNIFVFIEYVQ